MNRVLVVFKRSFLQQHRNDPAFLGSLDAATRARLYRTDEENRRTILEVFAAMARARVRCDFVYRGQLAATVPYDLVVTVGGDGTLLAASHSIGRTPVLVVNSDPEHSLGLFAAADRRTFPVRLRAALSGGLGRTALNRFRIRINGRPARPLVFNDVLFARRNPASMARYRLSVDGRSEEQRSSGLWISTAAGSTAAIRGAGGRRMPITSKRMQILAREPYAWGLKPYRLTHATSGSGMRLRVLSPGSGLWIDGDRVYYPLRYGDLVTVKTPGVPLTVLGYSDSRRRKLFQKLRRS